MNERSFFCCARRRIELNALELELSEYGNLKTGISGCGGYIGTTKRLMLPHGLTVGPW
jgi:hypothetical protein